MSIIERVVIKSSEDGKSPKRAAQAMDSSDRRADTISRAGESWADAFDLSLDRVGPRDSVHDDAGTERERIDPFVFEDEPIDVDVDVKSPARAQRSKVVAGIDSVSSSICLSERLAAPHFLSLDPNDPTRTRLRQEYRRIKRPLLFSVRSSLTKEDGSTGANMVLVTSALRGEGKTTNSINLAISIASEVDYHVLLIDGDLQLASASDLLGARGRPGLIEILQDDNLDLAHVLMKSEADNFTFLPAGRSVTNANELVASQAMFELMQEISRRYDDRIIIIDSAPLLASGDPAILARMVGQVALVVAADSTPQSTVEDALDTLPRDDNVGIILNKASTSIADSDYGYY